MDLQRKVLLSIFIGFFAIVFDSYAVQSQQEQRLQTQLKEVCDSEKFHAELLRAHYEKFPCYYINPDVKKIADQFPNELKSSFELRMVLHEFDCPIQRMEKSKEYDPFNEKFLTQYAHEYYHNTDDNQKTKETIYNELKKIIEKRKYSTNSDIKSNREMYKKEGFFYLPHPKHSEEAILIPWSNSHRKLKSIEKILAGVIWKHNL